MKTLRRPRILIRRQPRRRSDGSAAAWSPPERSPEPAPEAAGIRRIVFLLLAAVVVIGAVTAAALLTLPSFDRISPRGATRDATPTLVLDAPNSWGLDAGDVTIRVDGEKIAAVVTVVSGTVTAQLPRLADGRHDIEVAGRSVGALRRTITATWPLIVDTAAPGVNVQLPRLDVLDAPGVPEDAALVATRRPRLVVRTEPGVSVEATSDAPSLATARVMTNAGGDGTAPVAARLAEGMQIVRIVTTDAVGNTSRWESRVFVDSVGPVLVAKLPRVARSAELDMAITLRDGRGAAADVQLDGTQDGVLLEAIEDGDVAGLAAAITENSSEDEAVAAATQELPTVARYQLTSDEPLYEGRHVLTITAHDGLGNETKREAAIIVDSSEALSDVEGLRKGARGADVRELHLALIKEGATTRAKLGPDFGVRIYGQPTRAAVVAYQRAEGLDADGMAGRATIASLLFRVVVDRTAHTLTLYSGDQVIKQYGVAVGSPQYPTPAGEFQIVNMQKNPTWTPPDSEWAKDAKPIPPGPDNPLGTRWMGLDSPNVGIHGTNSPASIGYSVSHGCIRMAIPDVEDLYTRLEPGTPVTIV